ncbi:MAG: trehalose-6-phosphate synthase [Bacteroidetes bacterium]|nr:trehalose-6-phosphate synthase [Bacteroidota bacterium]
MNESIQQTPGRLVIVSNRLPVVLERSEGTLTTRPGSGGLVTALAPVLRDRGGIWIGWSGMPDDVQKEVDHVLTDSSLSAGYTLKAVPLSGQEFEDYYQGFANEILWPLFHDLQSHCHFDPAYWTAYRSVNRKFASHIRDTVEAADFIWVHDYHLMLAAAELRGMGVENPLGFFLHIPFPPPDIFFKLPWRFQILSSMLAFDLIGFQTMRDKRNFVQCVRMLLPGTSVRSEGGFHVLRHDAREVRAGVFPISIDYGEFERRARGREVAESAWYIHEALPDRQIVLGVDRLDYTKGIPYRLKAFRSALRHHPELLEKITLVQVVVPSRIDIPKYNDLKIEIEQLVGEINGEFTRSGWVPIHYIFRHLTRGELLGYYRTAEIALITPVKDGMNLVAKEYIACNLEANGVLILSEFAGAVAQLHRDALLVNPYDIEGMGNAIYNAFSMSPAERKRRMHRLRATVRRYDIYRWVEAFLEAAVSRHLQDFPVVSEYIPPADSPDIGVSI